MFPKRLRDADGSAVVGFVLAFPLIALLFLTASDMVISILRRETLATLTQQLLREAIRLPNTEFMSTEIISKLEDSGYEVEVDVQISQRNTAKLIEIALRSQRPRFTASVIGVYEQAYE